MYVRHLPGGQNMANKYNAFISYRHAPEDIKIASEVQKSLERFKIPAEIQKKTGIRRFERIFRDKEELPITSDLNDNIDEAIKNSDNLIVICSTRTCESIWVRKEIETFLKYHPRKNIFTVLVDGEPGDVIPDILLHDTVTVTNPDGTTSTKEILIEPLSCDYRMGIKKARKVELPRLAASLLDCSYDELVQRRRQYIRRRNAMIGTASACAGLCIMAYLIWSLLQIRMNYDLAQANLQLAQDNYQLAQANYETAQENYIESLNNQSRYLSTVSGQYMDNDDRVSAVLFALAALPSEGNERPVTTRAEYALTRAMGSYMGPGAYDMEPIWRYATSYEIVEHFATFDNTKMIAMDDSGDVTIWNTNDHSIYTVIPADGVSATDMTLDQDDNLYIAYGNRVDAYDNSFTEPVWSLEIEGAYAHLHDNSTFSFSYQGGILAYKHSDHITILDSKTGSILEDLDTVAELPAYEGDWEYAWSPTRNLYDINVSPDGRYIVVVSGFNYDDKDVFLYDREESGWIQLEGRLYACRDRRFTDDNKLVLSFDRINTGATNFVIGEMHYLNRMNTSISLFDLNDGHEIWTYDLPHTLDSAHIFLRDCEFDKSGEMIPALTVAIANKCVVLNMNNGNVLAENELTGECVYFTLNVDGTILIMVLESGQFLITPLSDANPYVAAYDFFLDGITDVDVYFSQDDTDIFLIKYESDLGVIEYQRSYYDRDYVPIELDDEEKVNDALVCGDKVLFFTSLMNLYCFDISSDSIDWKVAVDGTSLSQTELLCTGPDNSAYMLFNGYYSDEMSSGDRLFRIDLSDGKISRVEDVPYSKTLYVDHSDNNIVMAFNGDSDTDEGLYVYDMTTCSARKVELTGAVPDSFSYGQIRVSPDGKKAVWNPDSYIDNKAYLIDLESGSSVKLVYDFNPIVAWNPSSTKFVLGTEKAFDIFDTSGDCILSVPCADSGIEGICLSDDGIITLSSFGSLSLYDYDGNLTNSLTMPFDYRFDVSVVETEFTDDELFIQIRDYTYLVDMNEFEMRLFVPGLLAYHPESGRFFVKNYQINRNTALTGYYTRLTVEELIEKANQYIGDATLGEEVKSMYGISW